MVLNQRLDKRGYSIKNHLQTDCRNNQTDNPNQGIHDIIFYQETPDTSGFQHKKQINGQGQQNRDNGYLPPILHGKGYGCRDRGRSSNHWNSNGNRGQVGQFNVFIHFQEETFQQPGKPVIHQYRPASNLKRIQFYPKHIAKRHFPQE